MIKLEITSFCNHRCFYCYKDNNNELMENKMTIENVDYIINKLGKYYNDDLNINITGGEPFTNFEVLQHLLNKIKEKNYKYSINTNLTMNIEQLEQISRIPDFKIPLFISIPSLDKEIFEKTIKAKTYNTFIQNIIYIVKNKDIFNFVGNIVVTRLNYNDIINTINKCLLLGINSIKISRVKEESVKSESSISDNDMILLYNKIFKLQKSNSNFRFLGASSCSPMCMYPQDAIEYSEFCYNCNCMNDICITPLGDVKGCIEFPEELIVGNIFKDDIKSLEEKNEKICTLDESDLIDGCGDCIYHKNNLCSSGCPKEYILYKNKALNKKKKYNYDNKESKLFTTIKNSRTRI